MPHTLRLEIVENGQTVFTARVEGAVVELGRQRSGEPEPYRLITPATSGPARLLVARQPEGNISRQHARLESTPAGTIRVENLSAVSLAFDCGPALASHESAEHTPPFTLLFPGRSVRVERGESMDAYGLRSLDGATIGPGAFSAASRPPLPAVLRGEALGALVGWLQTTLGVLQCSIGSFDFLDKAVEAMVSIVGLDSGRAILFEGNQWKVCAAYPPSAAADREPSRRVLDSVRREKRTFWQEPSLAAVSEEHSLRLVQTVVAAPLLHRDGSVRGALYGERRLAEGKPPRPVGELEAVLVDLLAGGVAAGLARQEQERAALEAAVRFEQFFTPSLARHLTREPNLLEGREAEVTLLFSDICGFSRITERLGPGVAVRWVGAVLDEVSRIVLAEDGVLVDYIGDELLAMWGAPGSQPDHALRGVRAALAIVDALPELNAHWQKTLGEPMDLGLGLNTGPAHVGNTGSRYKFKYGPLGNTVNLASRVQGITRYLHCRPLATAATWQQLGEGFIARRVCRARVVNIAEPVDLFEIAAAGNAEREAFFRESQAALEALERGDFRAAVTIAEALLEQHPSDGPLRLTLTRAAHQLASIDAPFDPVWTLPGK
jgi:adenylate cyclase